MFLHVVDLAKPLDVYRFAKAFAEGDDQLDVLVRNNNVTMISIN